MNDLNALARRIAHDAANLPLDVRRTLDWLAVMIRDGYPSGGSGARASGHGDPVPAAALANTTGTGPGYRPADKLDLLTYHLHVIEGSLVVILDDIARGAQLHHATHTKDRCAGLIDPTCTRLRADGDGDTADDRTRFNGLCADCWQAACPACRLRPVQTGRRLPSTGEPSCEACYRREMRGAA